MNTSDLSRFLLATALLLTAAHAGGSIFRRLRQPPVIGEILGGLCLGPAVLGILAPEAQNYLFSVGPATQQGLAAIYQLGLLLLMFASGMEIRSTFQAGERKTSTYISIAGAILPFLIGLALLRLLDPSPYLGPANSRAAFLLVFAIAIAVTSIPVISRILLDLKILDTSFGRIILSAAVIEDILLYVVLSIALSLAGAGHSDVFGLPRLLEIEASSPIGVSYYLGANALFFLFSLRIGPWIFRKIDVHRLNLLRRDNPAAFLILVMLGVTGVAIFLGIPPLFGAFVAGMLTAQTSDTPDEARQTVKLFANAFFIPIYFAMVGLKLNLLQDFDPVFFALFFSVACAVKITSVYVGARAANESSWGAFNIGVAMNARGGPGIVLASVALDAGIINEGFYIDLVALVILTSLMAGFWLGLVVRKGWSLRTEPSTLLAES